MGGLTPLQARGHRFKSGSLHHLAARRISQHPAGKSCRVFALTPAARFPLASRPPPYRVLCILPFFVLPTLAGTLRSFRARRISQHPAGKPCRVFALTPAARFPLASRPPPYRVLCIVPFFVLPTLAGALRAFRARRISQHPAGKPCRVFALTPAARFPLASRTLPHKVSSLRFAPLRYFAGTPFERLQSGYFLYSVCCQRSRVRSVGEGSLTVFGARIALGSEKCVRSGAVSGTKSFDLIFALR